MTRAASSCAGASNRGLTSQLPPLTPANPLVALPETARAIVDRGEAIAVPTLYGRERKLRTLQRWVRDITGTATTVGALARLYGGNPLALQLISETIHELFGGEPLTKQGVGASPTGTSMFSTAPLRA